MDAQLVFISVVCSYFSEHPGWLQRNMHKRMLEFNAKFSVVVTDGGISHIEKDNLENFPG